jgi:Fe-Mn family superoxide dismutase
MAFVLPPLPWAEDALEPAYSARTVSFHYGKHHKAYVDKLNELTSGTDLEGKPLEEVIASVSGNPDKQAVFNNAAQVWNHTFFWNCMMPGGGGRPQGALAEKIADAWGGHDQFVSEFKAAAVARFGSGWTWLVDDNGELKITSTPNAEIPAGQGVKPLLTCDVWEHAYYLDYQNRRPDFVQAFFDSLVDWRFAASNLGS